MFLAEKTCTAYRNSGNKIVIGEFVAGNTYVWLHLLKKTI